MSRKPLAWSPTSLEDFKNCPYSYFRKRVAKDVKEERGDHLIYGEQVHKHFENRVATNDPLPPDLEAHEQHLASLVALDGVNFCEQDAALDLDGKPCGFWDKRVWMRAKIDFKNVNGERAIIEDYKTGKPHTKFAQLKIYSLHTFALHPTVQEIKVRYYWTKTFNTTAQTYHREDVPALWGEFIPDLKQYAEAFKTDTWQKRPSGLCGWCPVTDCQFWRSRRK